MFPVSTPRPREYEKSVRDKPGFLLPADQPMTFTVNENRYWPRENSKRTVSIFVMRPNFHPPKKYPKQFHSPTVSSGVTSTSVSATDMLVASFLVFTPTLPGTQDLILPADCDS